MFQGQVINPKLDTKLISWSELEECRGQPISSVRIVDTSERIDGMNTITTLDMKRNFT